MKLENVILVIFWVFLSVKKLTADITEVAERSLVIPQYISAIVHHVNEKDPSKTNDVVLIGMEMHAQSEMIRDIAHDLLKENSDSAVFIHDKREPIPKYRIHTASVIVIITDVKDVVSS